jgi:type IV pilus assembly protein PilM
MAHSIVGLDFGHGVIRAAEVGNADKAHPTLLRYDEIEVPVSAIDRGEVVEKETVAAALRRLWSRGRFKSKRVVLGVGNQRTLVREVTLPKVPANRIKESLPFQVQDVLPVSVAEALLDFYPVSESQEDGRDVVNGLLVAAIKDAVVVNMQAVQKAGLDPVDVDLVPFAIARAHLPGNSRGSVALVHVGAVATSVLVAVDGVPQFVRIIQNGGHDVNHALMSQLGMDASQAEHAKRGFGLAQQGVTAEWRPAVELVYQVTGDLMGAIRSTLAFYTGNRPGSTVDRILISGGGANLTGFATALGDATRVPVFAPNATERMKLSRGVAAQVAKTGSAGLPVAAGLALGSRV